MKHGALTASINVSRASLLLVSSVFLSTFSPHLLAGRTPALDEDLKRGAEKFVAVVESNNPSALLDLFSEHGGSDPDRCAAAAGPARKRRVSVLFPPGRRANETPEHRASVTGSVREPNGDGQHGN